MATLQSSSRTSSSYRSSSSYSSSFRSEGSLGASSDSLFEPFLHSTGRSDLFEDKGPEGSGCSPTFLQQSRSYGQGVDDVVAGGVRRVGDNYCTSADVSRFEPQDIVVLSYNHQVVIQAQKVLDDGTISDTFTHKCVFPEDTDPLSVGGALTPEGTLVVSVRCCTDSDQRSVRRYRSEAVL